MSKIIDVRNELNGAIQTLRRSMETIDEMREEMAAREPKKVTTTVTVWVQANTPFTKKYRSEKWTYADVKGHSVFKCPYSFNGLPDVDLEVAETLGKGAFAVKVECDEVFLCGGGSSKGFVLFPRDTFEIQNMWYGHLNKKTSYSFQGSKNVSDVKIEQAITDYLSKDEIKEGDIVWYSGVLYRLAVYSRASNGQVMKRLEDINGKIGGGFIHNDDLRKATPDEIADWFAVEVDGNLYRVCIDSAGDTRLYVLFVNGKRDWNYARNGDGRIVTTLIRDFIKHHKIPIKPATWPGEMEYPVKK